MMALTTEQQILVEQKVANESKSAIAAYLLWWLLGGFGVHNFYIGRTLRGTAELVLFIGGVALIVAGGGKEAAAGFGYIMLMLWFLNVIIDAFTIPRGIRRHRDRLRQKFAQELVS